MDSASSSTIALEGSTKIKLKLPQASQTSQGKQVDQRELNPEWLESFFQTSFFNPCSRHPIRRNDLNKYCIDCDESLCQYCLSIASHSGHRVLKMYRHVYNEVVPRDQLKCHIDCTKIQPYKCNKQLVIALCPLPHTGSKIHSEDTCKTCRRKLIECDVYNYCSIICQVEAVNNQQSEQTTKAESSAKKTRKRKGTPHRAPSF